MDALSIAGATVAEASSGTLGDGSSECITSGSREGGCHASSELSDAGGVQVDDTSLRIHLLTERAKVLAASTNARSSSSQKHRALNLMEPILLELHSLQQEMNAADANGAAGEQSLLQSEARESSEWKPIAKTGAAVGKSSLNALARNIAPPTGLKCFACLYMVQRAIADSSPFYTAAAQQKHSIGMQGEANSGRDRYGVDGVPIRFPMKSAYRTHGHSQGSGPFPGAPPGWGPPSSPVALQGGMPAPSIPFMPFMQREREAGEQAMGQAGGEGEGAGNEGAGGESPLVRVGNPNPYGIKLDYTKTLESGAGEGGAAADEEGATLLQLGTGARSGDKGQGKGKGKGKGKGGSNLGVSSGGASKGLQPAPPQQSVVPYNPYVAAGLSGGPILGAPGVAGVGPMVANLPSSSSQLVARYATSQAAYGGYPGFTQGNWGHAVAGWGAFNPYQYGLAPGYVNNPIFAAQMQALMLQKEQQKQGGDGSGSSSGGSGKQEGSQGGIKATPPNAVPYLGYPSGPFGPIMGPGLYQHQPAPGFVGAPTPAMLHVYPGLYPGVAPMLGSAPIPVPPAMSGMAPWQYQNYQFQEWLKQHQKRFENGQGTGNVASLLEIGAAQSGSAAARALEEDGAALDRATMALLQLGEQEGLGAGMATHRHLRQDGGGGGGAGPEGARPGEEGDPLREQRVGPATDLKAPAQEGAEPAEDPNSPKGYRDLEGEEQVFESELRPRGAHALQAAGAGTTVTAVGGVDRRQTAAEAVAQASASAGGASAHASAKAGAAGGEPQGQSAGAALPANWLANGLDRKAGAGISASEVKEMPGKLKKIDADMAAAVKQQGDLLDGEKKNAAIQYAKEQVAAELASRGIVLPSIPPFPGKKAVMEKVESKLEPQEAAPSAFPLASPAPGTAIPPEQVHDADLASILGQEAPAANERAMRSTPNSVEARAAGSPGPLKPVPAALGGSTGGGGGQGSFGKMLGSALKSAAKDALDQSGLGPAAGGTPVTGPFDDPVAVSQEVRKISGEDVREANGIVAEGAPLSPGEAAAVGILLDAPSPGPSPEPRMNPAVPLPPGQATNAEPAPKGFAALAGKLLGAASSIASQLGLAPAPAKEGPQLRGYFRAGGGEASSGSSNDSTDGLFDEFDPVTVSEAGDGKAGDQQGAGPPSYSSSPGGGSPQADLMKLGMGLAKAHAQGNGGGGAGVGSGAGADGEDAGSVDEISPDVQKAGVRRRAEEMGKAAVAARESRAIEMGRSSQAAAGQQGAGAGGGGAMDPKAQLAAAGGMAASKALGGALSNLGMGLLQSQAQAGGKGSVSERARSRETRRSLSSLDAMDRSLDEAMQGPAVEERPEEEEGAEAMRFASSGSAAASGAESGAESRHEHGHSFVSNVLGGLGLTPMPHACRPGTRICRQRYRGESDYAALRRLRRIKARSELDRAVATIRIAVGKMCSGQGSEGGPLPPLNEEPSSGDEMAPAEQSGRRAEIGSIDNVQEAYRQRNGVGRSGAQFQGTAPGVLLQERAGADGDPSKSQKMRTGAVDASSVESQKMRTGAVDASSVESQKMRTGATVTTTTTSSTSSTMTAPTSASTSSSGSGEGAGQGWRGQSPVGMPQRPMAHGLDGAGRLSGGKWSYATEFTSAGEKVSIGEDQDLGMPSILMGHCASLRLALDTLVDRYLHGYDTEEMCVAAKMCSAKPFMINDGSTKATSVTGRMAQGGDMVAKGLLGV